MLCWLPHDFHIFGLRVLPFHWDLVVVVVVVVVVEVVAGGSIAAGFVTLYGILVSVFPDYTLWKSQVTKKKKHAAGIRLMICCILVGESAM